VTAVQLQGKELSYNNIADADAAWEAVKSFDSSACVIVKHANPCGVALGKDALEAYSKAFQTDPTSAFGGIIAFNTTLDKAAAEAVSKQFVEVLIAPDYTAEALAIFSAKANVRVLKIALPEGGNTAWEQGRNSHDTKRIGSGLLIQTADNHEISVNDLKIVSKKTTYARAITRHAICLACCKIRQIKCNCILWQQHDTRRRRRPNEPCR